MKNDTEKKQIVSQDWLPLFISCGLVLFAGEVLSLNTFAEHTALTPGVG